MVLHFWQITGGVLVGLVIGGVAVYQIGHDRIGQIIDDPAASFRRLTTEQPRPAAPLSEKEQLRQADEQAKAKTLRDRQAQQLRADHQKAGGSEAAEAAARKERAWAKYYKKPAKCDGNPNNETMTECANDYIRSKRQFEEAYAAGKP